MKKKRELYFPVKGEMRLKLMKMKLALFLMFLVFFSFGKSFSQSNISLEFKSATIQEIIETIENKTEYIFLYQDGLFDPSKKYSINLEDVTIEEALKSVCEATNVDYEIKNRQIILKPVSKDSLSGNFQEEKEIRGTVTSRDGEFLPGVTVVVKGTNIGITTDFNGKFTLKVPASAELLVVSFVGMKTQEIPIGDNTEFYITMDDDIVGLEEVVVTALGIERSSKSLGYATSQVESDELTVNRTPNIMNALTGKMAGVDISAMGAGPGSSSKIRIRGQSSMGGNNTPLIVVNGVPIDNTNFGARGGDGSESVPGGGMTTDGGDGLLSINPDDVETMTVLKGAAASALYGSRAKDGVIMITTKKKGDSKGIGVTYNLNYSNNKPLDYSDPQQMYGQGEHGIRPTSPYPTSGQWSFGEKIEPGMTYSLYDLDNVPYVAQGSRIDEFYRHGQDLTNTITLSTNSEKGGMHLSFSNLSSDGITPNNSFKKNSINLGYTYNLTDKLSFQGAMNYSNEKNTNPPSIGDQDNTMTTALYNLANTIPLDLLKEYAYDENGDEIVWSRFRNRTNPYFSLDKQFHNIERDRIFGNISVKYDLFDWLFIQGRFGQDYWSRDEDLNNFPTGKASLGPAPEGFVNGRYTQSVLRFRETNADFLIAANKTFGKFGVDVQAGGNQMYRKSLSNVVQANDFIVRDLYTVENARSTTPTFSLSERKVNSLYASAEVSYNNLLYINGTVRNDWFSTLSAENRSIVYPSISASYVFTQSFSELPAWLNFGKLRAAYAEVGSDTDVPPYSNVLYYGVNSNLFPNPDGSLQPIGGSSGTSVPNPNLRPMRIKESEVGLEMRMFQNRVRLEVSAYNKLTIDQIISAQISTASGFSNTRINTGKSSSKGIEFMLNLVPVETNDFSWDFTFTGSYNKTKVLKLETETPGENILVANSFFNGSMKQVVGMEIGQVTGYGFKKIDGQIVHNAAGIPIRTDEEIYWGSALPNWIGGFTNTFNYKEFSLSFLIDFKLGGLINSGTNFNMVRHGIHQMSVPIREAGGVGVGVNEAGEINTVAADPQTYWEVIRSRSLIEPIVYNSGYWKLRQVTLGYNFSKLLPSSSMIKGLSLSLTANNVLILKKWVDNIDPDSFGFANDNFVGLESAGVPTTRNLGFNLNVKF